MRSLAEINERIQELEASMPNASRFPASYNLVRGQIIALWWVLDGTMEKGYEQGFQAGEEHAHETVGSWYEPKSPRE